MFLHDGDVFISLVFSSEYSGPVSYVGDVGVAISPNAVVGEFVYIGNVAINLSPNATIIYMHIYIGGLIIGPSPIAIVSVEGLKPFSLKAIVVINGIDYSNDLFGVINASFASDSAASFSLSLISGDSPSFWLDREIIISYQAVDELGAMTGRILMKGKVKSARFNVDEGIMELSGYDYAGVQNNLGEFFSGELNTILKGDIYINAAGVYIAGFNPIWDVMYSGTQEIEDGVDYFVDTLNGKIYVPQNSKFISFPGTLNFKYAEYYTDVVAFLQAIAGKKGWMIEFDGITFPDYSSVKNQPIISLSNESIIDVLKKLFEIGGGKLDTSLYPVLRGYSEKNNLDGISLKTFSAAEIFENTLSIESSHENLINSQTAKGVNKIFTSVVVGALTEQDRDEGEGAAVFAWGYSMYSLSIVDYFRYLINQQLLAATFEVVKEVTFSLEDVFEYTSEFASISLDYDWVGVPMPFEAKLESKVNLLEGTITYSVLRPFYEVHVSIPATLDHSGAHTDYYQRPFVTWLLIFKTKKISYGDEITVQQVEVTGTQTIEGVSDILVGDVYEHPYVETTEQATALTNAILTSRGLPHVISFDVPAHEFNLRVGDKAKIDSKGKIATGILESIDYAIDMDQAEGTVSISVKGKVLS